MLTDAHCHPFDLREQMPNAEEARRARNAACAASSWNLRQFEFHEGLAQNAKADNAPPLVLCYAVHPQLPASVLNLDEYYSTLEELAASGRLEAVGEAGFDLFDETYKTTEKIQDEIFAVHLEAAMKHHLPMVVHGRKAMHKIFPFSKELKKLPSVIFHSWPGTLVEGESLLHRGVNVFFSFGAAIVNNHHEAQRCCASLPLDRLLVETDAPYQPLRGKDFSSWEDLPAIIQKAAKLRNDAGSPGKSADELEEIIEKNFRRAFQFHD
ncbi:TatD family hydrolase [Leadbettera azotonutricia]|uniref:Hydrolase, TatD family n=1 Tax=Leadbettera azotonutricia (strain ATCC BAA-888 / DSM 13862 / ZAS-9) TaxID=545695 RepID=F5Y6T5_LEAAZ|nr:TatD family hydrolase [Leadbettera azotonutricia]AEF82731.1 hydrolase, TatD family [Leadbettera azotonutricia ZAS-9]